MTCIGRRYVKYRPKEKLSLLFGYKYNRLLPEFNTCTHYDRIYSTRTYTTFTHKKISCVIWRFRLLIYFGGRPLYCCVNPAQPLEAPFRLHNYGISAYTVPSTTSRPMR